MFHDFMRKYHPVTFLVIPKIYSGGSRQDLSVEEASIVYWNRKYLITFLHENLSTPNAENILQENLFVLIQLLQGVPFGHADINNGEPQQNGRQNCIHTFMYQIYLYPQ